MTTPTAPMEEDEDRELRSLGSAVPSLLPCPFCGGADLAVRQDISDDEPKRWYAYHIFCRQCHCHGRNNFPIGWTETPNAAHEAWNTRAVSPVSGGEEGQLKYVQAEGKTFEDMRESARNSELYKLGDMVLIWVNEGDLYNARVPLAALSKREKIEDRSLRDLAIPMSHFDEVLAVDVYKGVLTITFTDDEPADRLFTILTESQPTEASGSLKDDPDVARMMKGDLR